MRLPHYGSLIFLSDKVFSKAGFWVGFLKKLDFETTLFYQ